MASRYDWSAHRRSSAESNVRSEREGGRHVRRSAAVRHRLAWAAAVRHRTPCAAALPPGRVRAGATDEHDGDPRLVFAFVFAPLGIVFGIIGRRQIDRTGEGRRGLATAGLVVGIIFTAIAVLYIVLVIVAFGIIATNTP